MLQWHDLHGSPAPNAFFAFGSMVYADFLYSVFRADRGETEHHKQKVPLNAGDPFLPAVPIAIGQPLAFSVGKQYGFLVAAILHRQSLLFCVIFLHSRKAR
jgi:hypothetical protein